MAILAALAAQTTAKAPSKTAGTVELAERAMASMEGSIQWRCAAKPVKPVAASA